MARRAYQIESFETVNGEWKYVVFKGSDLTLPYLTVGLKSKDGRCFVGQELNVSRFGPGQRAAVLREPLKIGWFEPTDYEVYELPDPGPEDRQCYCEFERRREK